MKRSSLLIGIGTFSLIIGCGGGSSDSGTPATGTSTISGTVPGTLIEAFCQDGSYVRVNSTDNGTAEHPFSINVPAGTNCRLVMTTNENDPARRVITPIGFINNGSQGTTISLNSNLDMGHIPLAMVPSEIEDANGDHVADRPHYHDLQDTANASVSSTPVMDTDGDGIVDAYEDDDRDRTVNAYEDDDHDGTVNIYDDDDGNNHPDYIEDDDHDGTPNYRDDDDGDHQPDYTEDDDNDGVPNHTDDNDDNIDDDNGNHDSSGDDDRADNDDNTNHDTPDDRNDDRDKEDDDH